MRQRQHRWLAALPLLAMAILVPTAPASAAGATGPIVGIGGKCLDNLSGSTADGNLTDLRTCNGTSAQQWTLPGDGTIRVQGDHCLAGKHSGTTSGTLAWIWTCNGGANQYWTARADGTIVNDYSGLCLADKGGVTTDGNTIWLYTCDAGPAQLWQPPAGTVDPSGQPMPVGDLAGWHQVFRDDFATDVALGSFPAAVSTKWTAYSGFKNDGNTGTGTYDPAKTVSVDNGVLNIYLHTEGDKHYIAAPLPKIPGHSGAYDGMAYGRYAVRFRADAVPGYKTAWLLWPDSNAWPDGEIDFPEGNLTGTIEANMHHRGSHPEVADQYRTGTTYAAWHTAVIEWTPANVAFYLDGVLKGNDTDTAVLPVAPMHWVLQTETQNGVHPPVSAAGNVQIDWVSIWSRN
ncbi:hypothetical protein Cs7R123_02900 [Catellatospora sp. TT07R-123]|uniref:ricin-type beta-trefoil lectin domain protein n=1 Tax=Catellatospora sp. TT07R-123 TaxID=2733863 RepID=UPI001B2A75CA|nr:ricin-type beta-trefoil lectin domain protein [Catellatospora sp. TT07R-123]GHJ42948.1 hypothetical protein Cs7R123_02900 [Catellatospora sp. TT07R-123]